jgi:hypothetical protein
MKRWYLILVTGVTLLDAGFWPDFSFAYTHGEGHKDPSFVRDNTRKVVLDKNTGKRYYDAAVSSKLTWEKAEQYCAKMHYLGLKWRLPGKEEMRSLLELSRRKPTVKHAFRHVVPAIYWSATEDGEKDAWYFDFDLGRYFVMEKTKRYHALCVSEPKQSPKSKTSNVPAPEHKEKRMKP